MSLIAQYNRLLNIKNDIKNAIIAKGVACPDDDSIDTYAAKILLITSGGSGSGSGDSGGGTGGDTGGSSWTSKNPYSSQVADDEIWYKTTDGNVIEINPYTNIGLTSSGEGIKFSSLSIDSDSGWIKAKFSGAIYTVTNGFNFVFKTNIKEVVLPDYTKTLLSAFSGCTNLTKVYLGKNVISLDSYVFLNCTSLTTVNLPSSVTSIGSSTFSGSAISIIYSFATTAPTILSDSFFNINGGNSGTLVYPTGSDYSSWIDSSANYLGYYGWTTLTM